MKELDFLGKVLIENVRDNSLYLSNSLIDGNIKGKSLLEISNRLKELELSEEQVEFLKEYIFPTIVDIALDHLVMTIEENAEIKLLINNEDILDSSEGLSSELIGEDGWINKFSKYPSVFI